jgi:hypothetical protein
MPYLLSCSLPVSMNMFSFRLIITADHQSYVKSSPKKASARFLATVCQCFSLLIGGKTAKTPRESAMRLADKMWG